MLTALHHIGVAGRIDQGHDETSKEITKLQSILNRQGKEILRKTIQIKQSELESIACQQHF
jgi:ferritin-like metal-binding protein YciE